MEDLITNYSIQDILLFLTIFGLAVKGVVSFWDWAIERVRKIFKKENDQIQQKENIQKQIDNLKISIENLTIAQNKLEESTNNISKNINMLIDSDKDDIKAYITKEHHYFCYQLKWIDDHSLDCIEKRYNHYEQEGGNSFIKDLMFEIRNLPKQPPQD